METPYQYFSLAHRYIRLLQVSKSFEKDARIQCEFVSIALDNLRIGYTAVSYLWGPLEKIGRVWCNNGYIEVTRSAMSILEDVAGQLNARYIWIDALCIDQDNLVEKGAQVRLMRDVYASADKVVVWLTHKHFSDEATDFVITLHKAVTRLFQQNVPTTLLSLTSSEGCEYPSSRWIALSRFLNDPWFSRIWIIQEMAVSSTKINTVCGCDMIPWKSLAVVLTVIQGNGLGRLLVEPTIGNEFAPPDGLESMIRVYAIHSLYQKDQRPTLAYLLLDCWKCCATNGRDKIFALLGLASDAGGPEFDPDYISPIHVVLEKVAARLLTRNLSSFRILHAAGVGLPNRLQNLPSWVPDWTTPFPNTVFGSVTTAGYQACGNSPNFQRIIYNRDNHTITLSGYIIDNINQLAQSFPRPIWRPDQISQQQQSTSELAWIQHIRDLYPENSYPSSTDPLFPYVLSRVLVANMVSPGVRAPVHYVDYFTEYIKHKERIKKSTADEWNCAEISAESTQAVSQWSTAMSVVQSRKLFQTKRLYLGLAFPRLNVGDQICIFRGFMTPFIIRRRKDSMYDLVGECYIHGLMDGEGLTMCPEEDIRLA